MFDKNKWRQHQVEGVKLTSATEEDIHLPVGGALVWGLEQTEVCLPG